MQTPQIILYTRKIEMKFDSNGVSIIDIGNIIEEVSKEYTMLDYNPIVTVQDNYQLVTLKVTKKTESKGIGFNFGRKE